MYFHYLITTLYCKAVLLLPGLHLRNLCNHNTQNITGNICTGIEWRQAAVITVEPRQEALPAQAVHLRQLSIRQQRGGPRAQPYAPQTRPQRRPTDG